MNVSDSMTPAELEPEPDSTVPIRDASSRGGTSHRSYVNNVDSFGCSEISRKREARRPFRRMAAMARIKFDGVHPQRDPVTSTQQKFL